MIHHIRTATVIAALFISFSASAEEINPFNGAHGKIEALKLETEEIRQRNELLKVKTELARNQLTHKSAQSNISIEKRMAQKKAEPLKAIPKEKPAIKPVPRPAPKTKPKPAPKLVLTGVIETASGRQAIITKGKNKTWAASIGSKIGKLRVKNIFDNKAVLSNGLVLHMTDAVHHVSAGKKSIKAGGVKNEIPTVMGMAPPNIQQNPARF